MTTSVADQISQAAGPNGKGVGATSLKGKAADKPIRLLQVGESPGPCTSSVNLAQAMERFGWPSTFSKGTELFCTESWIKLVRDANLIVLIGFDGPSKLRVRQLALATLLGTPVLRWWIGSDVLTCLEDESAKRRARLLNRFAAANVAVAPHLVEELATLGIRARCVPSILDPRILRPEPPTPEAARTVLVYLPAHRSDFYGESVLRQAIDANPDLRFLIVADTEHRFADRPNVESLGWFDDMGALYPRVGCLLRVTRHDGLPRMVIEALYHRKYVIYSWPLAGCWQAKTFAEVQAHLDDFRRRGVPNDEGPGHVEQLLNPDPATRFAAVIGEVVNRRLLGRRLVAAGVAASLTASLQLRGAG